MKKVIILGGGLSGLSAGVYAKLNGFDVLIIEKNSEVGGLCTTWERDGVTIDGCIHWLTGSSKGNMVPIYKDLNILKSVKIYKPKYFYRFYYENECIEISRSLDDFKNNLLKYAVSANDKSLINDFIKMVKKVKKMPFHSNKPFDVLTKTEMLGLLKDVAPMALTYFKCINLSLEEYSKAYESEILKHFFLSFMPKYYSLIYFLGIISQFTYENADTIYNLSIDIPLAIKKKYLALGGNLVLNEEVNKLNIIDNKIISVETDKRIYEADYIINATPLPYFYNELLDKKYHDSYIDYVYKDIYAYPMISTVYVAMKIDKEYKGKLDYFSLIYDKEGIIVGGSVNETIHYRCYPYNKNLDGSTTLIALVDLHVDEYEMFVRAKNKGIYEEYKNNIAKKALDIYVNKFKDVKDYISIVDISTPLTFEKMTNTYKGAYLSNLCAPKNERKNFNIADKNINNLYYAGQWVTPIGGIPCALSNGKFAVDELTYKIKLEKKETKKKKKAIK